MRQGIAGVKGLGPQIAKKFPVAPQLRQQAETKREDEAVFLV